MDSARVWDWVDGRSTEKDDGRGRFYVCIISKNSFPLIPSRGMAPSAQTPPAASQITLRKSRTDLAYSHQCFPAPPLPSPSPCPSSSLPAIQTHSVSSPSLLLHPHPHPSLFQYYLPHKPAESPAPDLWRVAVVSVVVAVVLGPGWTAYFAATSR